MEGGLTDNNEFYFVPINDTANITKAFRKSVINLFVKKNLLNKDFTEQVLSWKHSGFRVTIQLFFIPMMIRHGKAFVSI